MKKLIRIGAAAALTAAASVAAIGPAGASARHDRRPPHQGHAVFVQTDESDGNQIVAYERRDDGSLADPVAYGTGGLGGALDGAVVDHLASSGSLTYDAGHRLLFATNAGSDTVSVFGVRGRRLVLRQVISSGGTFPVGVTVHGDLAYVLNARDGGSLQGFSVLGRALVPIAGSARSLGLDPTATPEFVNTPGQAVFTPDGGQLVVSTKANGHHLDVWRVRSDGRLSTTPTVNTEAGAVPFSMTFDAAGHLVVVEAGTSTVVSFRLRGDGSLSPVSSVATGQKASCWITPIGGLLAVSNTGSGSLTTVTPGRGGALAVTDLDTTNPGTIDADASQDGRYLYVQTGGIGTVDVFRRAGGALVPVGSTTVPGGVGGEGIVAL